MKKDIILQVFQNCGFNCDYLVEWEGNYQRAIISYNEANKKGETLKIEVCFCYGTKLPEVWHKKGYTKTLIPEYWSIHTFVYNTKGDCFGAYNPTVKLSEDGKRLVINFDWHFAATPENLEKLLNEVLRLFKGAK